MGTFQIFTPEQVEHLRFGGSILRGSLEHCRELVEKDMTTLELDTIAEEFIRDHGAEPGFKGYKGFGGTLCTSVNEECVHGLPSDRLLRQGDIISIDCGVLYKSLYTDACITVGIGAISNEKQHLIRVSRQALEDALEIVRPGTRIGDISSTVQRTVERNGCTVVRALTGHGLGDTLHQFPDVPNFGKAGAGPTLPAWTLFCIEPIICSGKSDVVQESDGWTVRTKDRSPCAHEEHTVLTTDDGYEIIA